MDKDEGVLSVQEMFFSSEPNYTSTAEESDGNESSDGEETPNVPDMVDKGKDEPLLWVGKFINIIKMHGQYTVHELVHEGEVGVEPDRGLGPLLKPQFFALWG